MPDERPVKPRSSLALLAALVDRPNVALADILAHPRGRWVLPGLLAILTTILSAVVAAPYLAIEAQTQMTAVLSSLPADQVAQMPSQIRALQTPLVIGATTAATGVLALVIGWVVRAAVLHFAALITGGESEFRRVFAAVPWLGLPFVLETVVQTLYVLVKKQMIVNQGLSYLVSTGKPTADAGNLAYAALSVLTLFWLWHLLLVFKLFRTGSKLSGGTAFTLTLVYAALGVGLRAALALLSRLGMSNLPG